MSQLHVRRLLILSSRRNLFGYRVRMVLSILLHTWDGSVVRTTAPGQHVNYVKVHFFKHALRSTAVTFTRVESID